MKAKALLLFAALFISSWTFAQNLDQDNTGVEDGFIAINSTSGSYYQTFTAGMTGPLEVVGLDINPLTTGATLRVRIRDGAGTGGPILASHSDVYIDGRNVYPWYFPSPANVTSGNQYTIEFIVETPGITVNWYYNNNGYAPGIAFYGAVPQPLVDFHFQTYVSPPNIPETTLRAGYCGNTLAAMNTYLKCYPVNGADLYEFRIVNGALLYDEQIYGASHNPLITSLTWAPGILNGTTYTIVVRARVGGTWGAYGNPCDVTTPGSPTPTTSLRTGYCGTTVAAPNTTLKCYAVSSATNYEFRFVNSGSGYDETVYGTTSNPLLTSFAQLDNPPAANTTYDITVRAYVGGAWGNYGSVCQVTTPANMFTGPSSSMALTMQEANGEMRFDGFSQTGTNPGDAKLTVYPNPSNGLEVRLKIEGLADADVPVLTIHDMAGKTLHTQRLLNQGSFVDEAITFGEPLPSGMYLMIVNTGTKSIIQKHMVR